MSDKLEKAIKKIDNQFKEIVLKKESFRGDYTYEIQADNLKEFMKFLKEDTATDFNMLSSVTGIDYLKYDDDKRRFGVVYCLTSLKNKVRLNVKVRITEENCRVDSLFDLWHSADWQEREIYDLYGIQFDGHPDLRRLFLDDKDFGDARPLRKDYPLKGLGERHSPLKKYGDNL